MNKVNFHYGYPINVNIDTDKQVDVYIDQIPEGAVPDGTIRIVILEEPKKGDLFKFYINKENNHRYTHLLTFYEEILLSNSKAQLFHFPNSWVVGYTPSSKIFNVSTVVGGKRDHTMSGYALRHELWNNKHLININKQFYLSGNAKHFHRFVPWREVNYRGELVLGASKAPLFDSMFHIAIENCSIKNYFSEKLLDCFQTKTVPIYCGCTNIGEYFNPNGIFVVENVREIIRVCNHLHINTYNEMLPAIEDNYERSFKWCDSWVQVRNKIIQLIS
jgi:hypothetical protein